MCCQRVRLSTCAAFNLCDFQRVWFQQVRFQCVRSSCAVNEQHRQVWLTMRVTAVWVTTCFNRPTTGAKEACDDDDSHGWWEAEENAEVDRHANESVCTPQWLPEAKAATAASAARLTKTTYAQVTTKIDCMAKEMMAVLCFDDFYLPLNKSRYLPCPIPSYLKTVPTRQLHPKKLAMPNFLSELKSTHYYVDDMLFSKHLQHEHPSTHGTTFFREEDTPIPFTSPHSPSNSAWAYPRGCHGPVERLTHRVSKAARPTSWPEPPLAGEVSTTSRRKHEVVTPPSNLWSDDEDGQPCWTGPEQLYCAGLPMGSELSPGRVQQLLRPRARTSPPHPTSYRTTPPTACHPGV